MEGNNNKKKEVNGSTAQMGSLVELQDHLNTKQDELFIDKKIDETRCWPVLFERSHLGPLNIRFDSLVLEAEVEENFHKLTKRKFQLALGYVILSCIAWIVYFSLTSNDAIHHGWKEHIGGSAALAVVSGVMLFLTRFNLYSKHYHKWSLAYSSILIIISLVRYHYVDRTIPENSAMSTVGAFCGAVEIVLLTYNLIPLPLYLAVGLSTLYSIVFETLYIVKSTTSVEIYVSKFLLHLCVHIVCISVYLMDSVRRHSTFWRISQSTMARRQMREEKKLKEDMIHSLMPPNVAKDAMESRNNEDEDNNTKQNPGTGVERGQLVFRQFFMDRMSNVSILFADIVGFTKMSSNKSAETLVKLLNDLFGRFDDLCSKNNCEKISTLGDCYYAVSGCPFPDPDHARNCLNFGLDMVTAIKEFDEEHNEEVNMRVGIHTGTVLCGIVGTRRFKFDVWSHDVDLANVMESTGQPGKVHISAATYEFLKDDFLVQEGDTVSDTRRVRNLTEQYDQATQRFGVQQVESSGFTKTYFILGPKTNSPPTAEPTESQTQCDNSASAEIQENKKHTSCSNVVINDNHNASHDEYSSPKEQETVDLIVADKRVLGCISTRSNSVHVAELKKEEQERLELEAAPQRATFLTKRKKSSTGNTEYGRKGSRDDALLLNAMREDQKSNYLNNSQVNAVTLKFLQDKDENEYRNHTSRDFLSVNQPQTFASPRFNVFLDVIVTLLFYVILELVLIIVCHQHILNRPAWYGFLVVSFAAVVLQVVAVTFSVFHVPRQSGGHKTQISGISRLVSKLYTWIASHTLGMVQLLIPLGVVYSAFNCQMLTTDSTALFFCYCVITAIVHSINLNLLSFWLKSVIAAIGGIVLMVLVNVKSCTTVEPAIVAPLFDGSHGDRSYEVILDIVLLIILVVLLTREIELMTRLAFYGDLQATKDKRKAENEKKLADSLLQDIIPLHVIDRIKHQQEYSQSHKDVGVVFISIINFDEFYDESFKGGKEFLRVLNELFADYEALFDQEKYKDIEKIKTIGSTFMAASGLNQASREKNRTPKDHLYALMDFCIEVLEVVDRFNEGMFNFDFKLKIGYNVGDIVSGVIGTSKLHFDIWGNTVNVSSRMYSTGVKGRVQVTEETAKMLEDMYVFEYRDTIYIKGKGDMRTYLLIKKRVDEL